MGTQESTPLVVGGHTRWRPADSSNLPPGRVIGNDFTDVVIANGTIFMRGQTSRDLETENIQCVGDAAGQTRCLMDNMEKLLAEVGASLENIVSLTTYVTDARHRPEVYAVLRERLKGVYPVSTGLVVSALAHPDLLVEVTPIAVLP